MKRTIAYLLTLAVLALQSCIKNDVPYPVVELDILSITGEGFTVEEGGIDRENRTVTLTLDQTTDISKVHITEVRLTPDAKPSIPLTGTFDLSTPLTVTLTLYQSYEWTIRAEQTIDRVFTVEHQVGETEWDVENCIAKVNVTKGDVDLEHVTVTELKLGPAGITTMTPTAAELTDFRTPRYVNVSYNNVSQRWMLYVNEINYHVRLTRTDLWQNTAELAVRLSEPATEVVLEYKRASATDWQRAKLTKGDTDLAYVAAIAPTWTEKKNVAGLTVHEINPATGVFAAGTYDYRLTTDGTQLDEGRFTTDAGDVIPDGDMASKDLPCFTTKGSETTKFWGSGNNAFTPSLCTPLAIGGMPTARLAAAKTLGILAAGNLFTATFLYSGTNGTVGFGQPYTYTARPSALKVRYRAQIGNVDVNKYKGPLSIGEPDKGRIFACIIDWSERHNVRSGLSEPQGIWDPEQTSNIAGSGPIIGYGSYFVTQSTGEELVELTIPMSYYSVTDTAPTGRYTIILSSSTSAYGDYINGCSTNTVNITDFEWVY